MSKKRDTKSKFLPTAAVRAPYTPPRLQFFGPVGALTQSGTGDMGENGMGMGMGQFMMRP